MTTNLMRTNSVPLCPICKHEGELRYTDLDDRLFDAYGKWNIRACFNPQCGLLWLDPVVERHGKAIERWYLVQYDIQQHYVKNCTGLLSLCYQIGGRQWNIPSDNCTIFR